MCIEAKQLVGDGFVAENVPFSFILKDRGEEMHLAPYAYITSPGDKIEATLDQSEKYPFNHICVRIYYCYSYREWLPSLAYPPNEIW